jgi:hypothetical protein
MLLRVAFNKADAKQIKQQIKRQGRSTVRREQVVSYKTISNKTLGNHQISKVEMVVELGSLPTSLTLSTVGIRPGHRYRFK